MERNFKTVFIGKPAHTNAKYGNQPSVMFYTHVSDQYAPFHTKVFHSTVRDATHVLDGLLNHKFELSIEEHYTGTVTASMVIRKLAAYPGQNGIAVALREIGRIEKTLFTLEWLQDPALRRRVLVGLNKGESKNALAREICRHRLGEISDRSLDDQWNKAGGLNFVIAAIVLWNTVYMGRAVEELRRRGCEVSAEMLSHVAPLGRENIVLTGKSHW